MTCSPSPQAALRRALADADIAGLISEQTLQQLSAALASSGAQVFPPILGSEADSKQLSHPELACPECGQIRKVAEGKASQAVLLHPGGCFEKLHVLFDAGEALASWQECRSGTIILPKKDVTNSLDSLLNFSAS